MRRKTSPPRRQRRVALPVLLVFLIGSGDLRIGLTASHALDTATAAPAAAAQPDPSCTADEEGLRTMLEGLTSRDAALKEREARIAIREKAVALAVSEAEKRIAALEEAEAKLSATLAQADQAAEKDVDRLVAVYEKMKPKVAATLFSEMEPDFAAGFLARMRPDAAAAIMAGLDPKTAYAISVMFAGRNAAAPRS